MTLDPRIAQLLMSLAENPPMESMPLAGFREAIENTVAWCAASPEIEHVEDREIEGVPVRIYHPAPGEQRPIVVWFHGGGWMTGSIPFADPICRRLCVRSGAVLVNVGYRLAPEHPFPAAVEDCVAVTTWLGENGKEIGGNPDMLVVSGDSAGGNLATVTATICRDNGGPLLRHELLICPVVDSAMDSQSFRDHSTGYGCTAELMRMIWRNYLQRPDTDFASAPWQAVPMHNTNLAGLPPTTIITMEYDPIRDEGEEYGRRLIAAGVPTYIYRSPGMIHTAIHLDGITPRVSNVYDVAAAALLRCFADKPVHPDN